MTGQTNLPDGTELMLTISRPQSFPSPDFPVCDYCNGAIATHCIGVTEHENTCENCLAKMSECAEQGHVFRNSRIMYSRVNAYRWLCCSRCLYDDLEPLYGVPAPQSWYKHLEAIYDGKSYLPQPPHDVF